MATPAPRRPGAIASLLGSLGCTLIYTLIRLFGRAVDEAQQPWLRGPLGGEHIGDRPYEELAKLEGLTVVRRAREGGLIPDFGALAGEHFDIARLNPAIRRQQPADPSRGQELLARRLGNALGNQHLSHPQLERSAHRVRAALDQAVLVRPPLATQIDAQRVARNLELAGDRTDRPPLRMQLLTLQDLTRLEHSSSRVACGLNTYSFPELGSGWVRFRSPDGSGLAYRFQARWATSLGIETTQFPVERAS
jgi:hypothetical protein